jgi:cytochrome c2
MIKSEQEQVIFNKILYIGSGLDLKPISHFPDTKEFVYVDTLPRSEWDDYNYMGDGLREDLYSSSFLMNLCDICTTNNFELLYFTELDPKFYKKIMTCSQRFIYKFKPKKLPKYINPHLITFVNRNTGQKLKYYFSTNIEKYMDKVLLQDIIDSDALIVSGYWPKQKVLQYFHGPKIYIGYSNTLHGLYPDILDDYEKTTIISFLYETTSTTSLKYFNGFYLVVEKTGEVIPCRNIWNLEETRKNLHSM